MSSRTSSSSRNAAGSSAASMGAWGHARSSASRPPLPPASAYRSLAGSRQRPAAAGGSLGPRSTLPAPRPTTGSSLPDSNRGRWVQSKINASLQAASEAHSVKPAKGLRHTMASGWNEPGCVVAAVAMAANVSYTQARGVAVKVAGFDGTDGLTYHRAQRMLADFSVPASWHRQSGDWQSLPNRALIAVQGANGEPHAVIFVRDNEKEILYDWKYSQPVLRQDTDYELMKNDEYLDLTSRPPDQRTGIWSKITTLMGRAEHKDGQGRP